MVVLDNEVFGFDFVVVDVVDFVVVDLGDDGDLFELLLLMEAKDDLLSSVCRG